ncbi:MAG: 3-dehydroquinate synthase [Saprospiraceae bacterium]|nr:3-dehydroquinate synthase [Saprospiraceae bacterium]
MLISHFSGTNALTRFANWLEGQHFSNIEILVDSHTCEHCLPRFRDAIRWQGDPLVIPAGEESKGLEQAMRLWSRLLDCAADRSTLLINLGGGVVTDLGGFVASTYKRGVPFVHVPTSLLGQVDAAIGSKTGIDHGGIKNSVGTFSSPLALVIDNVFLDTLPQTEYRSGMAEVFKHALIADGNLWKDICTISPDGRLSEEMIERAAGVKMEIVEQDPLEKSQRKLLNFGHSLGHAIESVALVNGTPIRHGEAVAAGMLMESWISFQIDRLDEGSWMEIRSVLTKYYPRLTGGIFLEDACLGYLRNDKKNAGTSIRMVLLEDLGKGVVHQEVSEQQSRSALQAYSGFYPPNE